MKFGCLQCLNLLCYTLESRSVEIKHYKILRLDLENIILQFFLDLALWKFTTVTLYLSLKLKKTTGTR